MEISRPQQKQLTPQQEDFVEIENHCCLCGTELVFEHRHDDEAVKIKEQGHCPCCKMLQLAFLKSKINYLDNMVRYYFKTPRTWWS